MDIKPIETEYAGCRFRSRLEARWAVFFDTLGVRWEYEPEGFTLSDGANYLPDFLLTDCGTWVEVKGSEAALNKDLMVQAAYELPHREGTWVSLLILGPIPDITPFMTLDLTSNPDPDPFMHTGRDLTWTALNGEYLRPPIEILRVGFGNYSHHNRPQIEYGVKGPLWLTPVPSKSRYGAGSDVYVARLAYTAARSARFEYGEAPTYRRRGAAA